MFFRLPKGSKFKLRLVIILVTCFLALVLFSKWEYVSKGGRMPYVRIPAFVISKRKNDLPLGTPIYADARKEDLLKLVRIKSLSGNADTNGKELQHEISLDLKGKVGDSLGIPFRGKYGDVFVQSTGKIFNVFIWDEICGENLDNLFNYPLFPYMPSRKRFSKSFKIIKYGQNFALWLVGYFTPLCSGKHTFKLKIKSGNSEVWISKDSSRNNLKLVLNSIGKESVLTNGFPLKKGSKYYFEVFHKEGRIDSDFDIEISNSDKSCKRKKQLLVFEPFMTPETVWSLKTPAVKFENELLVKLKQKAESRKTESSRSKRDDIFKIPFIDNMDAVNLLPTCKYNPSYVVPYQLEKYDGVWETHFTSIYPSDDTNITDLLSNGERQIIFGNDIMEKDTAMKVVSTVMGVFNQKLPGKYSLESVLNIEENIDEVKGKRYFVELELKHRKEGRTVRFSEYVYQPKGSSSLCYPENFRWNKSATVNIILTVGGQGRWAKYFVDSIEEVYNASKDDNINLIIVDFNNQQVNLKDELEASSIPRFTLLRRYGGFFKSEAIQQAANTVLDPNSIILLMDLHLLIPHNFIDTVRKHCVQGKMTFNPILARLNCAANRENPEGYWENVGYGIFAAYKSDWDTFGGMNYAAFKDHWGGEDWEMLDRVLMSQFEVERLKIKNLFHVFHTKKGMWHNFGT